MPSIETQSNADGNIPLKASAFYRLLSKISMYLPKRDLAALMPDGSLAPFITHHDIVRTRLIAVALRRISNCDQGSELHDSSRNTVSVVLTGGYTEKYLKPGLVYGESRVRFMRYNRASTFRSVSSTKANTWVLRIGFKRIREWGFLGNAQDGQASYRPRGNHLDQLPTVTDGLVI